MNTRFASDLPGRPAVWCLTPVSGRVLKPRLQLAKLDNITPVIDHPRVEWTKVIPHRPGRVRAIGAYAANAPIPSELGA